jgi:hypothetical protein
VKSFPILSDEPFQANAAADFLFSFENALHIHRKNSAGFQVRLQGFEVSKKLSLVIASSPTVKVIVTHYGLERRSAPFVQGLRRLDVIVSVDKNRWPTLRVQPVRMHDRMTVGGYDSNILQSNSPQMMRQPRSAPAHITRVFWLVADAGKPYELL